MWASGNKQAPLLWETNIGDRRPGHLLESSTEPPHTCRPSNPALTIRQCCSCSCSRIHPVYHRQAVAASITNDMATLNGAPADTVAPGHANTSITKGNFTITTRKLPILKAGPIEDMTKKLGITPPEMIFGDNMTRIEHAPSGWFIEFNALDALDRVDKTGENMFKVSYSREWQQNRQKQFEDIKEVVKPFDWSYSTDYKGSTPSTPSFQSTERPIPLELLKRPDPIHFFDEVMLYEDELADNGIAMLSCKIRVMPARLLLLVRFFMRLDDVVFRIRDTRVYVEFAADEVIREYTAREAPYEDVRKKLAGRKEDVLAIMRDPNRLAEHIPVVEKGLEELKLR
jgi:type 2A phosphatase activator TIP41